MMRGTRKEPVQGGIVRGGKASLTMALVIQDVPPGYDWGWYSREEPRMHVQTVDENHFKLHKVWLERDGRRVFEPAEMKFRGKAVKIPRKVLDRVQEEVTTYREDIEARWVRLMLSQQWLLLSMSGPIITLTAYPNHPIRFTRTIDLRQELSGFYDPSYPMTPKRSIKREEVTFNRDLAALEIWPKEKAGDRHHILLPPVLWRD